MSKKDPSTLVSTVRTTVYQNRHAHFRDIIERHGGQSRVAELLDISKQQVSHIAKEENPKNIGDKQARKIEMAFGLPIGLMDQPIGIQSINMDEFSVEVPLLNITASMGPGAVIPWSEEVVHTMRISKQWVRQNTQATSFDRLAIVTGKGDSMAPTFVDGDILLVDTSVTTLRLDAIYVLARGDELFIKRIQRNIDGSFLIMSDNPKYQPQQIEEPSKSGLLVLGRVLVAWNAKKL